MNRILKLSFFESKNLICNKLMIFSFIFVIILMSIPPYDNMKLKFNTIYLSFTIILMMTSFSVILSGEFENKTSKIIFTNGLNRLQVILWKLISILVFSVFLFSVYIIVLFGIMFLFEKDVNIIINTKEILRILANFIVLGTCFGTFTMMISSITFNSIITFIITFIFYDGIIANLINIVAEKFKVEVVRNIVKSTPFYSTTYGFRNQVYTNNELAVILISSIIFFIITIITINNRDLK